MTLGKDKKKNPETRHAVLLFVPLPILIGYRLRWRSDIWSTNRGAAEVGTPDIRPTTEDDIRHNATTQDKDLLTIIMPFFIFIIGC